MFIRLVWLNNWITLRLNSGSHFGKLDQTVQTSELIQKVVVLLGLEQTANQLNITEKSLKNWLSGVPLTREKALHESLEIMLTRIANPIRSTSADFTFIDLFAGVGGIRRGFEHAGGQCVFTSEWDKYAQKTYRSNFNDDHPIVGDITKVESSLVPDHDVLLAGFPCQPFSLAGVSKKNSIGRSHGFDCATQGTLFFDVERLIADKQPRAFLLENVKNLQSHDKGRTFNVIRTVLEEKLGYHIQFKVIDANGAVPQHRQRIFIAGFREETSFTFDDVKIPAKGTVLMRDILHPEDGTENSEPPYTLGPNAEVSDDFVLSDKLWGYLQAYKQKHEAKGNGFGFGLVGPDDTCRTLSARYHKDGAEILIDRGKSKNPRRLTPRECARLMGYPDDMTIPVSNTQSYRQFGNSVVVPVISAIAKAMHPHILKTKQASKQVLLDF